MDDLTLIDTRPGQRFGAPAGAGDYAASLEQRYRECQALDSGKVIYFGVAQHINAMIHAAQTRGQRLVAYGPHAGAAAAVIEHLSGNTVDVDVLA
ncbi:MAG: hypothetical protein PHE83_18655 [Opitutaceae bacterium]|nr:hypothetical protein [Opitutaceae bacterium]